MSTPLALAQATPATTGVLAIAADVALVFIAVAALVLMFSMIGLVRRISQALGQITGSVNQNLGPVSDRARAISDNVEFITQSVRADVAQLTRSVKGLTDRLDLASNRMEERIEEFNALMEVVQDEAEDIFLGTASTVRGVREGARSLATPPDEGAEGPAAADSVTTGEA